MGIVFASGFLYLYLYLYKSPCQQVTEMKGIEKGMQGRVKIPCMGYMWLLAPRSVVGQFMVVLVVTVSYCLFCGVLCFCVNVRIPLRLFSLMLPSAWCLSIVTDGHASCDWSLGPMLICVCLGDICVMIGLSLMYLVFFVCVLIRKVGHICFITT